MTEARFGWVLFLLANASSAGDGLWTSSGPHGGQVLQMAIHPTVTTTMLAVTRGGLFRTFDGGLTWERADQGIGSLVSTTLPPIYDRDTSNVIYVMEYTGRVFRSFDGGDTWSPTGAQFDSTTTLVSAWADVPGESGQILLAASGGGGPLLRSIDHGASFSAYGNGLPVGSRGRSIAFDGADPQRVLLGLRQIDGVQNTAYYSIDGGANWTSAACAACGTAPLTRDVNAVSFGPGSRAFLHSLSRVYASSDDGVSFSIPGGIIGSSPIVRLLAHPTDAQTAYLTLQSANAGVFRTIDGGATFTPVTSGLTPNPSYTANTPPNSPIGVAATGIYAEPGFGTISTRRLWVSTDGSGIYRATNVDGSAYSNLDPGGASLNSGLAGVNIRSIAVNPNPSARFGPGFPGNRLYAGFGDPSFSSPALYRTSNMGATWSTANNNLKAAQVRQVIVDPTTVGVSISDINNSVLYAVGRSSYSFSYQNGGIYKSVDNGASWNSIDAGLFADSGTPFINTVRHVVLDQRSCLPQILPCATPLQTLYATASGGTSTTEDTTTRPGSTIITAHYHQRIVRSTDAGASWAARDNGLPTNIEIQTIPEGYYIYQTVTPLTLLISPNDNNLLYVGTFYSELDQDPDNTLADLPNGVFKSTDGGANWTFVGNGLPNRPGRGNTKHDVLALAMHPSNDQILWAATIALETPGSASIYKSVDGGANWSESSNGIGANIDIRALAVDPTDNGAGTIYASGDGSVANPATVYKSTDGGLTWRSISVGLPNEASLAITIDPFVPAQLHVGTNAGVWSLFQLADDDHDGIPNGEENNAPGTGDGNGDGMPDAAQRDVGSTGVVIRGGGGQGIGGGFITTDIVSGTSTIGRPSCEQAVDVQARTALRYGRDPIPFNNGLYYSYPNDLIRFEITDCAQVVIDLTFHNENFNEYGWSFRFYGPSTPGADDSMGWYALSEGAGPRAVKLDANTWRVTLDASQFGSYRPSADTILFMGGPACFDDRLLVNGFEDPSPLQPPACN